LGNNLSAYEDWFIKFLLDNYSLFSEEGVVDFEFYLEVYYSGDQCNFELFDKEKLKKISHLNLSFPISVYKLTQKEYLEWEREIRHST